MAVNLKEVYRTHSGKFLKVVLIRQSGLHHFIEVSDNVKKTPIPEKRNFAGHVVHRVNLVYSEETILTFKKMKAL